MAFQSTRPRGARHQIIQGAYTEAAFQSTRPRGARRKLSTAFRSNIIISIHAPAWGATDFIRRKYPEAWISIHAPAWGATATYSKGSADVSFQSTRPRGARPSAPSLVGSYPYFNPRARVGRDSRRCARTSARSNFNPRARVGRDDFHLVDFELADIFQSTRPRGARRSGHQLANFWRKISIHAPAWGATAPFWAAAENVTFQSTRPRGARLPPGWHFVASCEFQSTRPRGARP